MGTWTLWVAFNAGVAVLLALDLGLLHRRPRAISIREAALESAAWVAVSLAFGGWIFISHGRALGLQFFTGYLIEKSLSADNVFVFLLIFRSFRVDPRYQHRLLFWGVLGALLLRGAMIAAGVALIQAAGWTLYLFGAFLVFAGFRFFAPGKRALSRQRPVHQWKVARWAAKLLPVSEQDPEGKLFTRERGRWLVTRMFLVILVLETADVIFATDSIPAVFGVTRDPFLVYSSNVCAILGLRAFYFLLAGALPYFRYLEDGLGLVLIFIGAKMLAAPWVQVSTAASLAVVGSVIAASIFVSLAVPAKGMGSPSNRGLPDDQTNRPWLPSGSPLVQIRGLIDSDPRKRAQAAADLCRGGALRIQKLLDEWQKEPSFQSLVIHEDFEWREPFELKPGRGGFPARLTTGIAVTPEAFEEIRAANGSPPLADVPPDQDAVEFELHFQEPSAGVVRLDILTTNAPSGSGAIARFLAKFGEGIQQVELDVTDVDRATEILRSRFQIQPIYPATRPGANGTRVNFFLAPLPDGKKMLVELVEAPKPL